MLSSMFLRASQFLFLSCLACSWREGEGVNWAQPGLYQKTILTDSKSYLLFLSKVKQHIFINLQSVSLRDTTPHLELSEHLLSFPEFQVQTFDHMMAVFYRPDSSLHNHNSAPALFVGLKQSDLLMNSSLAVQKKQKL